MIGPPAQPTHPLRVLVVDDEPPALEELAYLLGRDARVGEVLTASSGAQALQVLEHDEPVEAIFLDVAMPGLSGLDLARVLARFRTRTPVVFVTAHDDHAVEAFELHAVDYLLKPVRAERLGEAVRRVVEATAEAGDPEPADETIAVELGGVTRFVHRSEITYVEAQGDYARLHTADGSHLLRIPLSTLEESWAEAGFVRIHRSLLVATAHIDEVRMDAGRCTVVVGEAELQVARRHTRGLRERLRRQTRPTRSAQP
jgi:DNA-binding LytR/AlgR family response regulator